MNSGTPDATEDHWDEDYDAVVVGSGAGALTGAYVAARHGLRTLVVEKTGVFGGTSAYSGASCWLPGTRVQRRAGNGDSTESARTYLRSVLGTATAAKQEAFLAQAPGLVELLESDPALEFEWRAFPEYFDAPGRVEAGRSINPCDLPAAELGALAASVRPPVGRDRIGEPNPATTFTGGSALIGRLLLAFTNTACGTARAGCALRRLITEGDRVVGVEVSSATGGPRRIRARTGVLLAAGGFERNQELRTEHGVPGEAAHSMAAPESNTGEPMRAAVDIGATAELLDEAWWCPGLAQPDGGAAFTLGMREGFLADASGHRFANESLPYDRMGRELARVPTGGRGRIPCHFVFDSRSGGRLPAIALPGTGAAEHLAAGTWVRAETIPELARLIGVPPQNLSATVERFNGFAATGVDEEFHRGEDPFDRFFAAGQGPNPCLAPVEKPPFYAARVVLADLGTKGGLSTDTDARVLRADGEPIAGLYAAGNTSASLAGPVYPGPGIPLGTAMVFASLAARDMACRAGTARAADRR